MDLPLGVSVAGPEVVLDGVNTSLMKYVEHLALVHRLLFEKDLVITSGKDGHHVARSLHMLGEAVDVRTRDKDLEEQGLFLAVLSFSAPAQQIAVFDERGVREEPHVHLEWHGV